MTPLHLVHDDLLKIGLVSTALTPMDLRTFADWVLKPRLLAVPGVAKCSVFGGDVRQLQIRVMSERLVAYDLSFSDVSMPRRSTGVMGAGSSTRRISACHPDGGQSAHGGDARDGAASSACPGGPSVAARRGEREGGRGAKSGDALIQGRPGVLMTLSSQYGTNTIEVTRALEAPPRRDEASADQGIELYPRLHRPATFIEIALRNIRSSLLLGGVLVAVVLLLFSPFRAALISVTAFRCRW